MKDAPSPFSRLKGVLLAAALALSLVPAAAFADEPGTDLASRVAAANEQAIAEYRATGDWGALVGADAYDYPDNAIALLSNEVMPPKFDLRDVNGASYVTPVKLQNPWGTCWAFGAVAASETSILYELGMPYDQFPLDLSERHLAWMTKTPLSNGSSQDGEGVCTVSLDPSIVMNQGGLPFEATSVFSSGVGPVPEDVAFYRNDEKIIDASGNYYSKEGTWSVDQSLRFGQSYQLEESAILPASKGGDAAGIAAMKQELMAGRAIEIAFAADTSRPGQMDPAKYINTETWAHYTYEDIPVTHAVCVVGWDDGYEKTNFLPGHQPEHDGAWIVRNSWGASDQEFPNKFDWGLNGYFYLSYEDKSISAAETFDFDTTNPTSPDTDYWLVQQYDYMPTQGARSLPMSGKALMANLFTAGERMSITAASCETAVPGTAATYDVYLLEDEAANPTDGEQVAHFQKAYEFGGYHRELLENPILVEAGQRYSVVVSLEGAESPYLLAQMGTNKLGMETFAPGHPERGYCVGIVNKEESYTFLNGVWADWADSVEEMRKAAGERDYFDYDNFAIKAYGDPVPAPTVVVPDLVGMAEADALAALEAQGLAGAAGTPEYSDTVEAGRVIRQDAAAGTEAAAGSTVTYILSLGKAPVAKAIVPNVVNMTETDALVALKAANLQGAAGTPEYSATVEAGRVIRQSVAAGAEVDGGSSVAYVLSLGKEAAAEGGGSGKSPLAATGDWRASVVPLAAVGLVAAGATVLAAKRRREK